MASAIASSSSRITTLPALTPSSIAAAASTAASHASCSRAYTRTLSSSSTTRPASSSPSSPSPSSPSPSRPPSTPSSTSTTSSSSSIHASEIAHFSRLASQWWDPHGEFAILHAMNPVRIQFMRAKLDEVHRWECAVRAAERRSVGRGGVGRASSVQDGGHGEEDDDSPSRSSFLHGLDVLDVGCGGGFLSESLTRLGARTTGIDAASSNIQIARAHAALDPALNLEIDEDDVDVDVHASRPTPSSASSSSGSRTSASSLFSLGSFSSQPKPKDAAPPSPPAPGSSPTASASASTPAPASLRYRACTAEALLRDDRRGGRAQFDVVCAMEVLEHVRHPAAFLRTLGELLKPGGHLFLSTISRTPLAHLLTITMAERVLGLVSRGTHTYAQYVRPEELVRFFARGREAEAEAEGEGGGMGWFGEGEGEGEGEGREREDGRAMPSRLRYEVRGTAYLPWRGAWYLAERSSSDFSAGGRGGGGGGGGGWSTMANYFFWARKPFDAYS